MIEQLIFKIVFWIIGAFSGFFSIRMLFMILYRLIEKRVEKKKLTLEIPIRPDLFFSILVPARNESTVIQQTLLHLSKIQFPPSQFEIYIITDAKEESCHPSPTTFETAIQYVKKHSNTSLPLIHVISVPEGFDGKLNGVIHPFPIPSTKGRALNYCITQLKNRGDFHILSFFDAESHPDLTILQKLANRYFYEEKPSVYQGPLYQVRNFWKISFFSKIVSLTQAFSHEYSLPMILKWIPFLGGTNMHIPYRLMLLLNGFSSTTLTEDLELGVRIYLYHSILPKYIDVPSSEQTPATIKGYFYQRYRWGEGNVKTLNQIYQMILNAKEKNWKSKAEKLFIKLCLYGPGEWIAYFSLGLVVVFSYLGILWHSLVIFSNFFTFSIHFYLYIFFSGIRNLITSPMLISGLFIIILYVRYSFFITDAWSRDKWLKLLLVYLFGVFLLPYLAWMFAYPFVYAFMMHWFGFSRNVWNKTERTAEGMIE